MIIPVLYTTKEWDPTPIPKLSWYVKVYQSKAGFLDNVEGRAVLPEVDEIDFGWLYISFEHTSCMTSSRIGLVFPSSVNVAFPASLELYSVAGTTFAFTASLSLVSLTV